MNFHIPGTGPLTKKTASKFESYLKYDINWCRYGLFIVNLEQIHLLFNAFIVDSMVLEITLRGSYL